MTEANLSHLKKIVRLVPDGHDMDNDSYDVGWNAAISKAETVIQTEITMHNAWRKRAEEAEAELTALKSQEKPATIITDNTETLNNALKRIAELERDKPVEVNTAWLCVTILRTKPDKEFGTWQVIDVLDAINSLGLKITGSPPDHKLVADAHRGNMKIEGGGQ